MRVEDRRNEAEDGENNNRESNKLSTSVIICMLGFSPEGKEIVKPLKAMYYCWLGREIF